MRAPGLTLVDSGASHNFLSERVALVAGLCVDCSCHLNVKLADREATCQPRPGTWGTGHVCTWCSVAVGLLGCPLGYGCYSRCPLASGLSSLQLTGKSNV